MRILATISAALLFFFLAISAPAFSQEGSDRPAQAQDDKAKDKDNDKKDNKVEPKRDDHAVKQDDRGMKQDQDKRDDARPNAGQNVPEHPGTSRPEEAARPDRRQDNNNVDRDHQQHPVSAQRGKHIPDDKFRASFGREHHFHVDRSRVVNVSQPVVVYGGYSFQLVDAWPAEWAYTDDCYIDYVDDGYYLFDAEHPGIRIAVYVME